MISVPSPITTLRNPFCGLHANWLGMWACRMSPVNHSIFSEPNLTFVESPALAPAEVPIDAEQMKQYEEDIKIAASVPLPEEDEDL